MRVPKPKHQSQRKDAVRNYATQHVPGAHLNFSQRQTLASDWNAIVNAGCRITLRQFAAKHGLRHETWRREHLRGATGAAVPDPKDRRRRKYAEYDPFKAQDEVNENNANKGARMLVTNQMAFLFRRHVVDEKPSPYDALRHMKDEMPGQHIRACRHGTGTSTQETSESGTGRPRTIRTESRKARSPIPP